ncbi:MAG: prephenate dehydratase [Candidatus Nanopelagicales bacterium]|nr:prephenate dehydratase [Candidatus Nanopelagicales bacterium]
MPEIGTVVFLGPRGTFAEAALLALPELSSMPARPVPSVTAALNAIRSGDADVALVPIENSVEGSVSGTLDELASGEPLEIINEIAIPVRFALLAAQPIELPQIASVGTHPHAAAQCRRWLHDNLPHAQVVPTTSTAAAAEALSGGAAGYQVAIAQHLAAELYGLEVIVDGIADNDEASTRFVAVARPGAIPARTGADKTSLVLYITANRAGALLEILTEFAARGINLTRIESRPTRRALGDYCFSVDLEGHVADARVGEALMGLRRVCADVRFLGSYPRHDGKEPHLREGVSDEDFAAAHTWLESIRAGARR